MKRLHYLIERSSCSSRQVRLDDGEVKHGSPIRIYHKYIPHSALMLNIGAFTGEEGSR